MSGCSGSYSLGVGDGLPACLSFWVSEKKMCVVCSSSSSSETVVFLKLDCERKVCMKFPLCLPSSQKIERGNKHWSTGKVLREGGASLLREQCGWGWTRAHSGAPTFYAHEEYPIPEQSRWESLPGAQATTGPSRGSR